MLRWEDSPLLDIVRDVSSDRADSTAVQFDGERVSYREILDAARRFGRGVAALGHAPGEPAAVWLPNRPEWFIAHLGFTSIGAPVVAVNTRYRSEELAYMLEDSGATTLVLQPSILTRDLIDILVQVCPAVADVPPAGLADQTTNALERVVVVDPDEDIGLPRAATRAQTVMDRGAREDRPHVDVAATDPCTVFYTSGTTSKPKGVVHDHVSTGNHPYYVGQWFGITETDVSLAVLPICGVAGFDFAWGAMLNGATTVLHPHFDPEEAARAIEANDVTWFLGVGEMYEAILDTGRDLTSIEYASVYLTDADHMRVIEQELECSVIQPYGLSEAHSHLCMSRPTAPFEERVLPGGPPIHEGIDLEIRDPETNESLVEEPGELFVRGFSRMTEYLGKPDKTAEDIDADGWLATGDLCELDGEGTMRYYSRIGDMLRLRGFRVAPQEIETVIDSHPGVDRSQVVAAKAKEMGELPVAFVRVTDETVTPEELRGFLNDRVADFKVPQEFVFLEEFPVTESPNGTKIQRGKLAERAAEVVGVDEHDASA